MSLPLTQYWTHQRCTAAGALAGGATQTDAAYMAGVHRDTVWKWLQDPVFAEEVDRLTVMVGVSSRAERLRCAMRVLRSMEDERGVLRTSKDSLDWLKYAQSETDGAKIDLTKLAELFQGDQGEQSSLPPAIDTELDHVGPPQLVEPAPDDPNPS